MSLRPSDAHLDALAATRRHRRPDDLHRLGLTQDQHGHLSADARVRAGVTFPGEADELARHLLRREIEADRDRLRTYAEQEAWAVERDAATIRGDLQVSYPLSTARPAAERARDHRRGETIGHVVVGGARWRLDRARKAARSPLTAPAVRDALRAALGLA